MATDQATESLPDQLSSLPRVDTIANDLRMSIDVLLGHLRNQRIHLNPGDRVPVQVVYDALQNELNAGRGWATERIRRV